MSRLVTMSEIARSIGVSRQRVFVIAKDDPDFPEPALDAPRRRLWDEGEVQAWQRLRSTHPRPVGHAAHRNA